MRSSSLIPRLLQISAASILAVVSPATSVPAKQPTKQIQASKTAQAVIMRTQMVDGIALRIVDADLGSPNVHVTAQIASDFPGNAEPFSTLIKRSKPTAAINGAYFSKDNLAPIGDIVIKGQCVHRGDFKT